MISLQNSSYLQLGYGYLLARGLNLTPEELQVSQLEGAQQVSEQLLSGSQAALRMAALSGQLNTFLISTRASRFCSDVTGGQMMSL